jgi:hypothetical protein
VAAQTSFGSARNLHLTRAARVAGEAFAFNEPEAAPEKRSLGLSLVTVAVGVIVALTLVAFL